ncbi:PQQ-binding-like beta-propeller repeat protein [Acidobacteria bacterium AH-259-L09]|nr:PQQ-binding-like beta-propeller repeat protein [Acidobacteria bacterium AH-259-L09]
MRFCYLFLALQLSASLMAENWPHWRGPEGNGVSPERGLPESWSSQENVVWKAPIKGLGVSSPIVWEDTVFLTAQLGRGTVRPGNHPTLSRGEESTERALGAHIDSTEPEDASVHFLIQAFNRLDGSLRWDFQLRAEGDFPQVHSKTNMATPSCVTDGEGVYCWFGNGQLVALSMDGRLMWQSHLARKYSPFEITWGHSSSPTLYRDLLILLCDHGPASYLLALDKKSGQQRWKANRGKELRSYSTPMVVAGTAGNELIVNSSRGLDAYDPATGKHLWSFEEANRFPVPSPSFGDGIIFTSRGYRSSPYMAIQPGGRGDISNTHVRWRVPSGGPYVSSIIYYAGLVFMVNEAGIVTCADGKTGETVWKIRVGGVFSASPLAGDGKIYLTSEGGEVIVLRAARQPEILSRNRLEERCLASPAISNGVLFVRTDQHLFAVGRAE